MLGYYSTLVNTVKVAPVQEQDVMTAALLNDVAHYTFRVNNFDAEGDKVKLDGLLTGLTCAYLDVVDTNEKDEFGRPIYEIKMSHVPALEIVLDPLSSADDYSDARFIHRFKWVSKEAMIKLFGKKALEDLEAYFNHLEVSEADFAAMHNQEFVGRHKVYDNYLLVHSIIEDDKGDVWSCHWCQDTLLSKKKITYKEVRFPYRVEKIHTSNIPEFYGIFREVMASQDAINQALLKIQQMLFVY